MLTNKEWEMQPDEPPKAYAAFLEYCRLSPHTRSLKAVAELIGKAESLINRWSADWDWTARVRSYDRDKLEKEDDARVEALREMYRRHSQYAQTLQRMALEKLIKIDPLNLSENLVLKFLTVAVEMERRSVEAPTEIIAFSEGNRINPKEYDFSDDAYAEIAKAMSLSGVFTDPKRFYAMQEKFKQAHAAPDDKPAPTVTDSEEIPPFDIT